MGTAAEWRGLGGDCFKLRFADGGREQFSGLGQQVTVAGSEQTVVTDLDKAIRQDVLEEAADKLLSRDGATLKLIRGGILEGESDAAVFQREDPVITNGDAKDVRGEIFESRIAVTDRLTVDHSG